MHDNAAAEDHAEALRQHVHPEDIAFWCRIIPVAFEAAKAHGLDLRHITPNSIGHAGGYKRPQEYSGWCYRRAGHIVVCLRYRHHQTGAWLDAAHPEAAVWTTVAHELAHLRHDRHAEPHRVLTSFIEDTIHQLRTGQTGRTTTLPSATSGRVFALGSGQGD